MRPALGLPQAAGSQAFLPQYRPNSLQVQQSTARSATCIPCDCDPESVRDVIKEVVLYAKLAIRRHIRPFRCVQQAVGAYPYPGLPVSQAAVSMSHPLAMYTQMAGTSVPGMPVWGPGTLGWQQVSPVCSLVLEICDTKH